MPQTLYNAKNGVKNQIVLISTGRKYWRTTPEKSTPNSTSFGISIIKMEGMFTTPNFSNLIPNFTICYLEITDFFMEKYRFLYGKIQPGRARLNCNSKRIPLSLPSRTLLVRQLIYSSVKIFVTGEVNPNCGGIGLHRKAHT
jgi:hypothetical protein